MKISKNVLKAMVAIGIIAILFVNVSIAQTTPTIFIDGIEGMANNISASPYWLSAGQTLAKGNKVNSISVVQYNIAPAQAGGNSLQFESVLSVSTQQSVPIGKTWKVESIMLDPTASVFGGDNLGNHTATANLNMANKNIYNLANPASLSDAVNTSSIENNSITFSADGGTANAYIVTLSPAPSAYTVGMIVSFKAANANTTASTLNVNGLGAKSIKKLVTANLETNDIKAGQCVSAMYDGTNFQLLSPVSVVTVSCTHTIGESYGGGIVFYIDASGCHGLIAATSDQSTGIAWSNITATQAGSFSGNGAYNTSVIMIQGPTSGAAYLCRNLSLNGYTDWYLPSLAELRMMYAVKTQIGGLNGTFYWSSDEDIVDGVSDCAWPYPFPTGHPSGYKKTNTYYVHAIRAF